VAEHSEGELENITAFEEWQQEWDRVVRNISEAKDEETVKAVVETAEKCIQFFALSLTTMSFQSQCMY
jgi:hypothetical protein